MLDTITTDTTLRAEHKDITAGVTFLMKTIERRTTTPILSNILFSGDGSMQATDLDQVVTWKLDGVDPTVAHAPFTVSADSLLRAIKGADAGKIVSLCISDAIVTVTADGMASKLRTLPVEDFPVGVINVKGDAYECIMDARGCFDWLTFLRPCISDEETRYYLNGILLHPRVGVLSGVATNGHKLAIMDTPNEWSLDGLAVNHGLGTLMPKKAVDTVMGVIGKKATGWVEWLIGATYVTVHTDKWAVCTKHIDGTFPDYTRVIPASGKGLSAVDRDTAIKALTRIITTVGKNGGTVAVDTAQHELTCTNSGEPVSIRVAFKECGASLDDKAPSVFGINPAYLKDTLGAFPEGDVFFTWDDGSPVRFQQSEVDWTSANYRRGVRICMPMRL